MKFQYWCQEYTREGDGDGVVRRGNEKNLLTEKMGGFDDKL